MTVEVLPKRSPCLINPIGLLTTAFLEALKFSLTVCVSGVNKGPAYHSNLILLPLTTTVPFVEASLLL